MRWQIITVGKPALAWAKSGIEDYQHRVQRYAPVDYQILKEAAPEMLVQKSLDLSEGAWRVVLDERGKTLSSKQFATWMERQEMIGRKKITFFIGGANGHSPGLREKADEVWSLSSLTLQHELAYLMFMEQFYRAFTIRRGEPYHRD